MPLILNDSYLCPRCPGHLRIYPATEANIKAHRAYHREQKKRFGEMFRSSVWLYNKHRKGGQVTAKRVNHRPAGRSLMAESIPKNWSNGGLNR